MSFNKFPFVETGKPLQATGWAEVFSVIEKHIDQARSDRFILAIECYQGVLKEDLIERIESHFKPAVLITEDQYLLPADEIGEKTKKFITDDRIFGMMNDLSIHDLMDEAAVNRLRELLSDASAGISFIVGTGASEVAEQADLTLYADMARWEIQQRMRSDLVSNIGRNNHDANIEEKYKIGYFLDWRICDILKKKVLPESDYILDANKAEDPLLVTTSDYMEALSKVVRQPFSLVPFFDPGPWGGQWMKEVCDLDKDEENYAWCFNCVPEENSLLLEFGEGRLFESPSINLVFFESIPLLGHRVYDEFGAEFPIRFDFLDTMDGGNLSLQVHPSKEYIASEFGLSYTQDESYYMMEAGEGARVYLGVREGVDQEAMIRELKHANNGGASFKAEDHVCNWPARKHDHFLIPNGTVHCSGKDCMVLEISATPYIFTFKLWDWGRLGLDGRPRPINIERGSQVIRWHHNEKFVRENLINRVELLSNGADTREERTGLYETQFIETRRHWFREPVTHKANGSVHVLNLVEGDEVTISCPDNSFPPLKIGYAETFVIPATITEYVITPTGKSAGKEVATVKAFVKH
jgi:mannose-6-phosphate isomerase class I